MLRLIVDCILAILRIYCACIAFLIDGLQSIPRTVDRIVQNYLFSRVGLYLESMRLQKTEKFPVKSPKRNKSSASKTVVRSSRKSSKVKPQKRKIKPKCFTGEKELADGRDRVQFLNTNSPTPTADSNNEITCSSGKIDAPSCKKPAENTSNQCSVVTDDARYLNFANICEWKAGSDLGVEDQSKSLDSADEVQFENYKTGYSPSKNGTNSAELLTVQEARSSKNKSNDPAENKFLPLKGDSEADIHSKEPLNLDIKSSFKLEKSDEVMKSCNILEKCQHAYIHRDVCVDAGSKISFSTTGTKADNQGNEDCENTLKAAETIVASENSLINPVHKDKKDNFKTETNDINTGPSIGDELDTLKEKISTITAEKINCKSLWSNASKMADEGLPGREIVSVDKESKLKNGTMNSKDIYRIGFKTTDSECLASQSMTEEDNLNSTENKDRVESKEQSVNGTEDKIVGKGQSLNEEDKIDSKSLPLKENVRIINSEVESLKENEEKMGCKTQPPKENVESKLLTSKENMIIIHNKDIVLLENKSIRDNGGLLKEDTTNVVDIEKPQKDDYHSGKILLNKPLFKIDKTQSHRFNVEKIDNEENEPLKEIVPEADCKGDILAKIDNKSISDEKHEEEMDYKNMSRKTDDRIGCNDPEDTCSVANFKGSLVARHSKDSQLDTEDCVENNTMNEEGITIEQGHSSKQLRRFARKSLTETGLTKDSGSPPKNGSKTDCSQSLKESNLEMSNYLPRNTASKSYSKRLGEETTLKNDQPLIRKKEKPENLSSRKSEQAKEKECNFKGTESKTEFGSKKKPETKTRYLQETNKPEQFSGDVKWQNEIERSLGDSNMFIYSTESLEKIEENCINFVEKVAKSIEKLHQASNVVCSNTQNQTEKQFPIENLDFSGQEDQSQKDTYSVNKLVAALNEMEHPFPRSTTKKSNTKDIQAHGSDSASAIQKLDLEAVSKMKSWREQYEGKLKNEGDILMDWINRRKVELKKHPFEISCTSSHGETSTESTQEESSTVSPRKVKKRKVYHTSKKGGKKGGQASCSDLRGTKPSTKSFIWLKSEDIFTTRFRYDVNCAKYSHYDFNKGSSSSYMDSFDTNIDNEMLIDSEFGTTALDDLPDYYDVILREDGNYEVRPRSRPHCRFEQSEFSDFDISVSCRYPADEYKDFSKMEISTSPDAKTRGVSNNEPYSRESWEKYSKSFRTSDDFFGQYSSNQTFKVNDFEKGSKNISSGENSGQACAGLKVEEANRTSKHVEGSTRNVDELLNTTKVESGTTQENIEMKVLAVKKVTGLESGRQTTHEEKFRGSEEALSRQSVEGSSTDGKEIGMSGESQNVSVDQNCLKNPKLKAVKPPPPYDLSVRKKSSNCGNGESQPLLLDTTIAGSRALIISLGETKNSAIRIPPEVAAVSCHKENSEIHSKDHSKFRESRDAQNHETKKKSKWKKNKKWNRWQCK